MSPHPQILSAEELRRTLLIRDLTDEALGPHALQLLIREVELALARAWGATVMRRRAHPVVSVADNYDHLGYPPNGPARDARYTRYVSHDRLLRSHTSAMVPPLLRGLAEGGSVSPAHVLLSCPGIVYRRDAIGRLHTGEPHQLDLWRLSSTQTLGSADLAAMIALVVASLLPGHRHRTETAEHPYTLHGLQIDVEHAGSWIEIGECGLAHPAVLSRAGVDVARWTGLASGLGLDRLLMLRKGIDDIRLLRSSDPRVAEQMRDLERYRAVSAQPAVRRDLSVAVDAAADAEVLGDRVRAALGVDAELVEAVEVCTETAYEALVPQAIDRLGMRAGQKNVLLRIVLRDLVRTLTHEQANRLRDRVYAAVHEGARAEWACPSSAHALKADG